MIPNCVSNYFTVGKFIALVYQKFLNAEISIKLLIHSFQEQLYLNLLEMFVLADCRNTLRLINTDVIIFKINFQFYKYD